MLVSLAIVSLLIALLLPAAQYAREAARRTTCLNRLHQIGIALENFNSATGKYPAASVASINVQGQPLTNNVSPHVELLPYLDQSPLYAQFDRSESGAGVDGDPPRDSRQYASSSEAPRQNHSSAVSRNRGSSDSVTVILRTSWSCGSISCCLPSRKSYRFAVDAAANRTKNGGLASESGSRHLSLDS